MLRLDSGEHVDACLSIRYRTSLASPCHLLRCHRHKHRLASRGSNSETALPTLVLGTSSKSSAPLPLGSPFSHQTPWTAPGQCIALVNLPRPLPLRGYRRAAMPSDFATHFPLSHAVLVGRPCFASRGASLRYDGTGRLTCRMVPCVAPSLASFYLLWDSTTSGHVSDRLLPRDFYTVCLQTPVVGQTPVPGHIPAAAASPRHDVRMARGVAVDGDRPNRLITMPPAPRMLPHRSLMPRKEQSLSLLLCPQAVPWTSTGTAVNTTNPVDTILLFWHNCARQLKFIVSGWMAGSIPDPEKPKTGTQKSPLFPWTLFTRPPSKPWLGIFPPVWSWLETEYAMLALLRGPRDG